MDCSVTKIPYSKTGYFSKIVTDYISGNDFLKQFYAHPVSIEGIQSAIKERKQFNTDRSLLVDVLKEQYSALPMDTAVLNNINKLADKNTFVITTAHQPAIFTGTLYFIYKILHAIKLAAALSEKLPEYHFVPVYYMGSEDADLDELGHIYLDNEKLNWDTKQTGAVGRMNPKGLEKIIARVEGEFSSLPHGTEILQLLKKSYLESESIQAGTLKLLNVLFGEYGLIVLIPDHDKLKKVMEPVFREDLFDHIPCGLAENTIEALSAEYPVQAKPRKINLFYLKDNIRERIDPKEEDFVVHRTKIRFTRQQLEEELKTHPERFSPNVILRGLFQETILPGVAFIGGGGEMAYWLELKAVFNHYKVPFPVLLLRNSFLIIEKQWSERMQKTRLGLEHIFLKENVLLEMLVKKQSLKQLSIDAEIASINSCFDRIKSIAEGIDPTLAQHTEALESRLIKKLEGLEKKIIRAEKRNYSDLQTAIQKIRAALFPLENLQERIDNFIPYYALHGKSFIDVLYKYSLTLDAEFMILEEH